MIRKTITIALGALALAAPAMALAPAGAQAATGPTLALDATWASKYGSEMWITATPSAPWQVDDCTGLTPGITWRTLGEANSLTADPVGLNDRLDVRCSVERQVKTYATVTAHGSVHKPGLRYTSRSSGLYNRYGSCNRVNLGGLLTTCGWAHANFGYTLTLPLGRTFASITHSSTAGIFACHGSWSITHKPGTRTWHATFTHGSRNGLSQCIVDGVSLHYTWHKRVARYSTVHDMAYGTTYGYLAH